MKPWAWVLGLVLVGCSDAEKHDSSPAPVLTPKARAATVVLYGDAATSAVTPFPSDRYTILDSSSLTGRRVKLAPAAGADPMFAALPNLAEQLSGADGFSTVGGVAVSFQGDLDPAILALGVDDFTVATAPLVMVDVDAASPERGKAIPLIVSYYPTPTKDDGPRVDFTLVAQPARPLRPRTEYLFAVTSHLTDAKGAAVGPSEATDSLLASGEGEYGVRVRAALPLLKTAVGVGPEQIALATLFTTATMVDETFAMAKNLRAAPPPGIVGELSVVEQGKGTDKRVRFKGLYNSPEFRQTMGDKRFHIKDGAPVAQSEVDLEFLLSFSDREAVGPRPVVIYAHGIGDNKEGVWATSQRLAEVGVAVIGIDAPEHGSRTKPGGNSTLDFFALNAATGAFDLFQTRDNFRQMASDHLELVRLIAALSTLDVLPVGAPDGVPDLDPSRIFYIGHSFGSILASTTLAVAPEIKAACLNVGGAGLATVLRESNTFHFLVKGLFPTSLTDGDLGRFLSASQAIMDPGDPLNFTPHVSQRAGVGVENWAPRHLLLQEVFGDLVVPNMSSELLARGLGLAQVTPTVKPIGGIPELAAPLVGNATGGTTAAFFQFDKMNGGQKAVHGDLIASSEARSQYVRFFQDAAAGKTPVVVDPYGP